MQTSVSNMDYSRLQHPMPVRARTLVAVPRPAHQNRLLRSLPPEVFEHLSPHLTLVELARGTILHEAGLPISYAYFPIDSIVALFYTMANGDSVQTAMVGFEGMVGISSLMGWQNAPSCAVMQSAGTLIKVRSSWIADAFELNPKASQLLLRYAQSLFIELAQSVACNRHHSLEAQLCRWLLMTLDRQQSNEIIMTHELIANQIGVRREGVSAAAGRLQRQGLICYRRGHISILDRPALERRACECYDEAKSQTDLSMPTTRTTRAYA